MNGVEMMLSRFLQNLGIDPNMISGLADNLNIALETIVKNEETIIKQNKRIIMLLENQIPQLEVIEHDGSDSSDRGRTTLNGSG